MPRFAGTLVVCGLTLLAGVGCSSRQIVPEPAVQAVEPAQVTIDALQQAQHIPETGTQDAAAEPSTSLQSVANLGSAQSAAEESNPFFIMDDETESQATEQAAVEQALATDEPNPFAAIEQTSASSPATEDTFVEHATHVVKEGCAGPDCELIGLEPVRAPGADQTNPQESPRLY